MKTIKLSLFSLALTAVLFSCRTTHKTTENKQKQTVVKEEVTHKKHWTYTGDTAPKYWSHLSEKYFACDGKAQSPINISEKELVATADNKLQVNYKNTGVKIENNGHTLEFVVSPENTLNFNGKTYELKQFHMHTPSEHTVNNKHFPLEMHFVNKADDGTYAVISVLFKEGKASPFLAKFLKNFPKTKGEYEGEGKFDFNEVLPNTNHYYHYKGSFTTPPCTEAVEWIILKEHPTASKEQMETLHKIMGDNFRPVQALNGRKIEEQ
jgi:carbonic anhydrase